MKITERVDVLVIGSGMGGATFAAGLAPTGTRILVLERGERLRDCESARDARAIFQRGVFRPQESWLDGAGQAFNPGNYYYVGGNTKFYGAVLIRYRAEDFAPIAHREGTTPGWPFSYDELEPWYTRAEQLYNVRGALGLDSTEPVHSTPYPLGPVPDEPAIAAVRQRLKKIGLNPFSLPPGIDIETWLKRAKTVELNVRAVDRHAAFGTGQVLAHCIPVDRANRLSVDPSIKVLLLESGWQRQQPAVRYAGGVREDDQGHRSLGIFHGSPAPPRELRYTQAKVLGGGSSINAQVYTRGNARDYDDWAARGATGWSYAEVLPYFKRAEDNQRFVDIYHARRRARRLIARQSASNQRSLSPGRSGIRNSLQSRFQMPSRRASDIIR